MNKKIIALITLTGFLGVPLVSMAQLLGHDPIRPFNLIIANLVLTVLAILWIVAIAFVIIMFVFAGFKYLTARGDPNKVHEANLTVIWGLAGAAVIILAWSVITILRIQFGI